MLRLTTTTGIYEVLKNLAPADLWTWAELHVKHWKTQARWTFDMDEAPVSRLCYFAALISAAAADGALTSKRRAALSNLYNQVRLEAALGDELLPQIEAFKQQICGRGEPPERVSADLWQDFNLPPLPSKEEHEAALLQKLDRMGDEAVGAILAAFAPIVAMNDRSPVPEDPQEAQEAPQEPPAPTKVQAVAEKLAALHAAPETPEEPPEEPAPPRVLVPSPQRRANFLLAELFRSMGS